MTSLGGLDALFLHLETAATPMHVGALHLLEPPPGDSDLLALVRDHVGARLHLSPVFTRRLLPMPLSIANPAWTAAAQVDLQHHVQRVLLPAPGTRTQLEAAVARLHALPLDRSRPLWQFFVLEGLADGRCALYSKVHHAAVDGVAGVALAQALLDTSPIASEVPPSRARRRTPPPGPARLLGAVLTSNARAGARLLAQLPAIGRTGLGLLLGARRGGGLAALARHFAFAPATALNGVIDARRSVATTSMPLRAVRAIADANEVTLNDVILAIVGGALRRYLSAHGGLPAQPLLAAMPVSLRQSGDTAMNTQATMTQASLATHIEDPLQRLRAIHAATLSAKAMTRELLPALEISLPSLGLPWLLGAAATLYGKTRLAERLPPLANVVVSNVPGPPLPLYLAGAKLLTYWPLSIVVHGLALNITVQRYADSLDIGVVAARNVAPDLEPLIAALQAAFAELAGTSAGRAVAVRPAPGRKRAQRSAADGANATSSQEARRKAPHRRNQSTAAPVRPATTRPRRPRKTRAD